MPKIFAVEDDDNIRELVCYALRSAGFEAEGFENASAFRERLRTALPDLILLDIMLPDEDGLSVLRSLRGSRKTQSLPVMLLTAKGTEYDRVTGLDTGADDYLVKPFSLLELISRVKAILRRGGIETAAQALRIGTVALDMVRRTVHVDGEPVELTFKEFELLYLMMRHAGVVLTRDSILTQVWGYEYDGGTNRTVDMHIKTLRQKLGTGGDLIKTVRGLGYKLTDE